MSTPLPARKRPAAMRVYMTVAAIAAVVGLVLLALMMLSAPTLVRFGMVGQFWYVLLVAIGLSAAVVVFALFRSWASYAGTVLNGKLEFGGPAVVMVIVILLGFWLPPPAQSFDMTVFLRIDGSTKQLTRQGRMRIDLGAEPREVAIGDFGEARFIGIPHNLRGRTVPISYEAEMLELADANTKLELDPEPKNVQVRVKARQVAGTILDDEQKPLAGARVSIAGLLATTNADGRFEIFVPADLPEAEKVASVMADGFESARVLVGPGGSPLTLPLTRK